MFTPGGNPYQPSVSTTYVLPYSRPAVFALEIWIDQYTTDLEDLRYSDEYCGGNANRSFDSRAMLVDREWYPTRSLGKR